ncbi:MAG: hypothetical protein WDM86_14385 [Rhizomicrobium sp.]
MTPFVFAVASILLSACSHNLPPAPPPAAPQPKVAMLCGADSPVAAVDRKAICDTRAALNEADLPDAWRDTGGPVARVILIPAGQPALSLRAIGAKLTVRRLAGGKLDVDRTIDLTEAERATLRDAGAAVWGSLGPIADAPTFAPCRTPNYIVAETNLNTLVKFAVSHCVALKPLRDLADAYLAIASEKVPELKQGLEQSLD